MKLEALTHPKPPGKEDGPFSSQGLNAVTAIPHVLERSRMTPENANAFERLVAIMSGDYAQLLIRGELIARTDDPAGWRKEMRDNARLDRLTIRAGRSERDSHVVWAIRVREPQVELDDEGSPAFKDPHVPAPHPNDGKRQRPHIRRLDQQPRRPSRRAQVPCSQ